MLDYQAPSGLLNDRVILVTGSSDGIGKAAAKEYARLGATIILHGKNTSKLEKVYDEIVEAGYPQPAIIPLDLVEATAEQYKSLASTIQSELGRLDGILHNASTLDELSPVEFIKDEKWQQMMQVNINAVFLLTKYCLPLLRQAKQASIIMTSSGVGRKGRAFWGSYAVSKFATEGFMQVLADELEDSNIRVNAINPGATRTKMRAKAFPAENKDKLKTPEEITPIYNYLMGDDSSSVHGQSLDAQARK